MKRNVHISVIAISTLLMLFLTAIPHHHHDHGLPCFQTEKTDLRCDQQHAGHHHATSDPSDENSNCILHANFITQHTNSGVRIKLYSTNNSSDNQFHPDLFANILTSLITISADGIPDYGDYFFSYFFFEKPFQLTLRGPPYLIV